MDLSFEQKKTDFVKEIESSQMFSLIDDGQKKYLLDAINASSEDRFEAVRVKFLEDEAQLAEMDRKIAEAEQKKNELIAKKKAFMADLSKNIAQDRIDSDKAAEDALKKLEEL